MDIIQQFAAIVAKRVVAQLGKKAGHKLDMKCRVSTPPCKRKSRGPRFGYICDTHRDRLTAHQQQLARDAYNARKRNGA